MGHLGSALARYEGFENYGLKIAAAFDSDEKKWGTKVGRVPVLNPTQMGSYIEENHVNIAVIAVPAEHAQAVADQVVGYGIRAIWNFAPKDLKLDEDVVVQRTDLATSFAVLSAQVKLRLDQKKHRSGSDTW